MEPQINLTLSLSVVNAALNALEQQAHAHSTAIAAIKNQAVSQLQAGAQTSAAAQPSADLPFLDSSL